MSLEFAAITPHPPIIVKGIGSQTDLQKAASTCQAMNRLAGIFRDAELDCVIVISPHMLIYNDRFNICAMKKIFGSFASFDAPEIMQEFSNDTELAHSIFEKSQKIEINTNLYDNGGEFFELDHGVMVPMSYFSNQIETPVKVLPIAYSGLSRADHFAFGQSIFDCIKNRPERIGVVASGDLSHRLIQASSQQQSKIGKLFDQKIVADLKEGKTQEIINYDEDFLEEAGECGYRSILILLGILDGKNYASDILSYEGPFGVGYLVANFNKENN